MTKAVRIGFGILGSAIGAIALLPGGCTTPKTAGSPLVLWAWERPEDLRFLPRGTGVAVQTGFIAIAGDDLYARGRRFALRTVRPPDTAVVHLQIDERRPLRWSPFLRRRVAAAVMHYATTHPVARVQIDFEVRASQRRVLLDVLTDIRRSLPRTTSLSMTALASWCDGEPWLDSAPVDEIVPMLFRMGRSGAAIRQRLADGGDLRDRRCRTAFAIATDEPLSRAPAGRRVYVFDPERWTARRFATVRHQVEAWR